MACPTCDHSLECVLRDAASDTTAYQCPRCGTSVVLCHGVPNGPGNPRVYVPQLVERCREFAGKMNLGPLSNSLAVDEWRRLGIAESINLPAARPKDFS